MSNIIFNEHQMKQLEANPNVVKVYHEFGEEGFYTERRGKGSTGRPSSKELTAEEQLEKAQARIDYLEAQLDFVKKLDKLERQAKKKRKN